MFGDRSILRRNKSPLYGKLRTRIDRRQASACFEWLEERQMLTSVSWIGGTTGYWDAAANWSNGAVPTSATAVSIATSRATVTIQPGFTASAGGLTIAAGAALSMPGGVAIHQSDDELDRRFGFRVARHDQRHDCLRSGGHGVRQSSLSSQYAYTGSQSLVVSGVELRRRRAVLGNARRLVHDVGLRDDPANRLTGNATAYLQFVLLRLVVQPAQLLQPRRIRLTVLTASSATGGPLAGSVGNQGWNHFDTTAVAPSGTAYIEAQLQIRWGHGGQLGLLRRSRTGTDPAAPRSFQTRCRQYFQ